MWIRVLGAAAGGGFPQWNCGCPQCRGVREGTLRAQPRTQECVAISSDGDGWFLLNASPEIRAQIESFPPLHPRAPRDTPIRGVLLTNGDLDHWLGLLSLRESQPLTVWATETVRAGIVEHNAAYRTLARFDGQCVWRRLRPGRSDQLMPGLTVEAIAVPGKPPLHLARLLAVGDEHTVGFVLRANGKSLAYFSSVASLTAPIRDALDAVDVAFFDGTFWSSDELIRLGVGDKRSEEMAHIPVQESLPSLARARCAQRFFIHINNTNPILRDDSDERASISSAKWQVARDGLEIHL
jgi:pyrroloquinoline quinone biosynthesis protein B